MSSSARRRLVDQLLDHLVAEGRTDLSLRHLAAGIGSSHSLLLHHFGSRDQLLTKVHRACEERQRKALADVAVDETGVVPVMRATWRRLAEPSLWPLYRLGFMLRASRVSATSAEDTDDRHRWVQALRPLVLAAGVPEEEAGAEALLWLAACRGLLWELVTGAGREATDGAAERFFVRYVDAVVPADLSADG